MILLVQKDVPVHLKNIVSQICGKIIINHLITLAKFRWPNGKKS